MIDEQAGRALGGIIVSEVKRRSPLLAVAISYETAQSAPALYLAYETAEHCMARLTKASSNASTAAAEAFIAHHTGDDEHYAVTDRLRGRIGSIFNTGEWINPADPVLLGRDPIIDKWAERAFQAILESLRIDDDDARVRSHTEAYGALGGTLWFAIDHARQHAAGPWPPISFVHSFDDHSDELITVITSRKPVR